jgi:hypothetical protein
MDAVVDGRLHLRGGKQGAALTYLRLAYGIQRPFEIVLPWPSMGRLRMAQQG